MRVLLVEDDAMLVQALVKIFEDNDIDADTAADGNDGYQKGLSGGYDVIIMDVMMPGIDGYEAVRRLCESGISTPIIMLTAKAQIHDKIEGFDAGADDYMVKPFAPVELLAHLRALVRRASGYTVVDEYEFGELKLNIQSHDLSWKNKTVNMSVKEFQIMEQLMKNIGHITTKQDLLVRIWGHDSDADDNNVEAYISLVRKKLKFLGAKVRLETIRKVGYRLVAEE